MRAERQHPHLAFAPGRARNHDREYAPAPLFRRWAAGLFDVGSIVAVSGAVLFAHFTLAGALFPLWVVAATVVAWLVLPQWLNGRTVGFALFGLRLIRADGQRTDLLELAFRDLLARGFVSWTIIAVAVARPVIESQGAQELPTPSGLWSAVLVIAAVNVTFGVFGQCLCLVRSDRRSVSDLLAKVIVVDARAHRLGTFRVVGHQPTTRTDAAELWREAGRRRERRAFWVLQASCLVLGAGVPLLSRVPIKAFDVEERFARSQAELRLQSLREREPAQRLRREEQGLREQLEVRPNWTALERLVDLLTRQSRIDEARSVYQAQVEIARDGYGYQAYGVWLYENHFDRASVRFLRRAIASGADEGLTHAYLGLALDRIGERRAAKASYRRAIVRDPTIASSLDL
ncbi:MAG: RDD family protein [Myxococcota bacterium]